MDGEELKVDNVDEINEKEKEDEYFSKDSDNELKEDAKKKLTDLDKVEEGEDSDDE